MSCDAPPMLSYPTSHHRLSHCVRSIPRPYYIYTESRNHYRNHRDNGATGGQPTSHATAKGTATGDNCYARAPPRGTTAMSHGGTTAMRGLWGQLYCRVWFGRKSDLGVRRPVNGRGSHTKWSMSSLRITHDHSMRIVCRLQRSRKHADDRLKNVESLSLWFDFSCLDYSMRYQ
jgi:hypothetical protein